MAVRYVTLGQFPDVRIELRGRLSENLAESGANPGTYACPEDVVGCFLEMGADGLWAGASVGTFSSFAELDALPKGNLAVGAQATANGVPYTYHGGVVGWVGEAYSSDSENALYTNLNYLGLQIRPGAVTDTDAYIDNGCMYYDFKTRRFYILYVGVSRASDSPYIESIHLASSKTPTGPWAKLGQIITPTGSAGDPDAYGCTGASEPIYSPADGLYYVYYIGTDAVGYEKGNKTICLATSPSITGPYTHRGAKIHGYGSTALTPAAVWHRTIVKSPHTGGWDMFFNVTAADGGECILHASAQSIAGPWTIDASQVVLDRGAGWDSKYVADPSIIRVGDFYYMAYWGGSIGSPDDVGAGLAVTPIENFPYGWEKVTDDSAWFNRATIANTYEIGYVTKPRFFEVDGSKYIVFSSSISTGAESIGSGIHLMAHETKPKGIFPKYRNGSAAFSGPGYSEFGIQVGDYLSTSLPDRSSVALTANKSGNSYNIVGQANGFLAFFAWIYNVVASSAYALIETYGCSNPIIMQTQGGSAGKQGIAMGSSAFPSARSVLDLNATSKGFRPPRLTTAQRDAVSWVPGDEGMVIYNATTHKLQVWNGSAWETITSA